MAPLFKNKTAEPFFVTMPYSEAEQNVAIKLSTHAGQEFDIVVKGSMKMQVGSHVELLHEGDSIYYNSAAPHGMIATGGADCQIYAIVLKGAEEFVPEQDRFQKLIDAKIARQDRETVSTPFVETTLDENGILNGMTFKNEEKNLTLLLTSWISWRKNARKSLPCSMCPGIRQSAASPSTTIC